MTAARDPVQPFVLVILWVVLAVTGDGFLRTTVTAPTASNLALGTACYAATVPVAILTYRCSAWSWVALMWSALALLLSMAIAVAVFHEPLTWRRVVSAGLILVAMGLAE